MARPIPSINNASTYDGYIAKYEMHYDLVKVVFKDMTVYIPAPKFFKKTRFWILQSAPREAERTNTFFNCPLCREASFFDNLCKKCAATWDGQTLNAREVIKINFEANLARQERFLRCLDVATAMRSTKPLEGVISVSYIYASWNVENLINSRDRGARSTEIDSFLRKRDEDCSELV